MSIEVMCPRCQGHFPIADDLADETVCCPKCANVFQGAKSAGIKVGLPAQAKSAPGQSDRDDDEEPRRPSRPHATARAPFPAVPLLILTCGLLFLLLVLSAGFNFWMIGNPEHDFGADAARRAEREAQMRIQAQEAADRAEQARVQAEQAEKRAALAQEQLRKEVDDLRKERDALRMVVDELKADK